MMPQCSTVGLPSSLGLRARTVFLASSTLRRKSGGRPTHAIRYRSGTHNASRGGRLTENERLAEVNDAGARLSKPDASDFEVRKGW
jgi:hypothetical protein